MNSDRKWRRAFCARYGKVSSLFVGLLLVFLHLTAATFVTDGGKFQRKISAGAHATDSDSNGSIVLPIFPLRKRVRLPTEQLTLNLYEERYLALAEHLLQRTTSLSHPCWCGALYAADQPHLVTQGGMGPIVPMVTPGQIGVTCWVHDHSEAHVPTVGGDQPRRRIRLDLIATQRFQIQRVLQNGYGGGSVAEENGNREGSTRSSRLPFILVEAQLIRDVDDVSSLPPLVDKTKVATNQDPLLLRFKSSHPFAMLPSDSELYGFRLASRQLEEADSQKRLACLQARSTAARLQQFQ